MEGETSSGRDERAVQADNLSEALLKQFEFNGAKYFFNSGGTEYAPIWERFAEKQIRSEDSDEIELDMEYIGCRHEDIAVQMAMGYTILEGDPQVVGLHTNIGGLNCAMSIHGAYRHRIPMVLLESHAETHENELLGGTPGHHYFDFDAPGGSENYFSRYLKWMHRPGAVENIPRLVSRAFQLARSEPNGPVMLNVSREKFYYEDVDEVQIYRDEASTGSVASEDRLDEVAEKLVTASNPMIITGKIGNDEGIVSDLVTLSERLNAPVIEHPKWYTSFPTEHENYLCSDTFVDHYLTKNVDLVLVLGSKRPWYPPEENAPDGEVIMVGENPTEPELSYWQYPTDVFVRADPERTVERLLDRIDSGDRSRPVDWSEEHSKLRDYWMSKAEAGEGREPIDPFWFCQTLDDLVPSDAIVIQETIAHRPIIVNLMDSKDRLYVSPDKLLASGIGGAVGVALGTKLARPDRPVVALVGDGSFNYTPVNGAFGAAQEHNLPILTIVFNNAGYQSHKDTQLSSYPEGFAVQHENFVGTQFQPNPNYAELIDAWDGLGRRLSDPEDVVPGVQAGLEAIDDGTNALLDVVLDDSIPEFEPPA